MFTAPLFSIVIPTRNRPHLLRHALESALAQRFDDYEILVSDNSSNDETHMLVQEFSDPRIRYIRTPASLSMPDSWEFAIREAHGRYITYLCDDDALVPRLLPTLATMIQQTNTSVVTWAAANYHHPHHARARSVRAHHCGNHNAHETMARGTARRPA